jgi:hypothetical protein
MAIDSGKLDLRHFSPCMQLSMFRSIRDKKNFGEDHINRIMTHLLIKLGESRFKPKMSGLPRSKISRK